MAALDIGALWNLSERINFVRENVETLALEADFAAHPESRALWSKLIERSVCVQQALQSAAARLASRLRSGELSHERFRSMWEGLGFSPNAEGAGTPGDDFLDGMFHVSRLTTGEERPSLGTLNMASRAHRIADFLTTTRPGSSDVVYDLGSGSGKLALTVAASTLSTVRGVERGESYVASARRSAERCGLSNVDFAHADVRDVDLSPASIFYLYYPFHEEVARSVATTIGRIARAKQVVIYSSGPLNDYGEYFLEQVANGSLLLAERRGEFSEVMVLRSAAFT